MNETIKIIIVDDSKLTRIGLKATLSKNPELEVIGEAENGLEGVEIITKLQPDIVLMDIGMPFMDGIQAVSKIKELGLLTRTIVLTSHDSTKDVLDALKAGANSYCMKDIEPDMLITVIKTTYQGASWLDPAIANVVLDNVMIDTKQDKQRDKGLEGSSQVTEREIEVLKLIAKGLGNQEIADHLYISLNTVKTHIKNIFHKLEVDDRTKAVMKAVQDDII